ncbi:TolC family protein [Brevundimonas naejangsanensis]|uniref:TolC family protein n=2 Tax=Brevundimonas naejangsanensis TaxID=588932 RepID=UPI0026E9DBF0|nr:TolC family protein [Brevundimonas naejangsanensis]
MTFEYGKSSRLLRLRAGETSMALRHWLLGLAVAPLWASAHAQSFDATPLDYREAQARLLQRSDAVAAADADVRSKEAQEDATRTLRTPTVEFEAQHIRYEKTLFLPLGPLADVAQDYAINDPLRFRMERGSTRPIVTATMPIYSGGQIPAVQAAAAAQVSQSRAERETAVDDALLQMSQLYFGQQLLAQVRDIRLDVLSGLDRHVSDAIRLERAGFISRAQRLQAEVARDDAARELEKARADLAGADAALSGVLRAPSGVEPTTPIFMIRRPLDSLESYLASARRTHPQLERLRAMEEQAEAAVDVQRARLRPTVYGFAQYNLDRREALLADPDWSVGVGLRYTLLSGEGRSDRVRSARETVARAQAGLREAHTQIEIGVARAWNDAEAARRRFMLTNSAIASSQENLRVQTVGYQQQQTTSLDVIDAQLGVGRSRVERAQAAHDFVIALARLLHVSGEIDRMPDYIDQGERIAQ